ncbi:hypothetical protein [Chromobacterium violaceum]|uniref:hypothetical protein n=1 Tax=Chromobacterium violaceum TaxID=536 RepID=UPI0015FB3822|nr:hypothetical protein [Chromobacterium violaceum]MBA8735342.1 hypothetical protein [Chromobacterium violaceum]
MYFEFDFKKPFESTNAIAEKYLSCMVSFFHEDNGGTNFSGFGSGFLVRHNKEMFIATAEHVISDAVKEYRSKIIANINHKFLSLNTCKYCQSANHDLAVFHLSKDFIKNNNLEFDVFFDASTDFSSEPNSCLFSLLMGYPYTKNQTIAYKRQKKFLFSITSSLSTDKETVTSIINPLIFEFDKEKVLNSEGTQRTNPPHLKGMSGGVALGLYPSDNTEKGLLKAMVQGVLVEWDQENKIVVASSISKLKSLMTVLMEQVKKYEGEYFPDQTIDTIDIHIEYK